MQSAIGAYHDGRTVHAWRRDESGRRVFTQHRADHACYVKPDAPEDVLRRLRASSAVRGVRPEGDWLRVSFRDRDVLYRACADSFRDRDTGELRPGLFPSAGIATFEADLDPVRRWALDESVEVLLPRRCWLDIETDSRVPHSKKESARILCWTIADDAGEYVTGVLEDDTDAAERDLLLDLLDELERFDQVIAWAGDWFDFPVIFARLERARIRGDVRRWLWVDHLPIFRRMNISSSKSGDEKQSMSLDAIGWSVAKVRKLDFDASRTWEFWEAGGESRELLARYNAHDVFIMKEIERKTGYIELHNALSATCGVFPDTRAGNPLRYVDNFILRLARDRGWRLPTMYGKQDDDDSQFLGAYVMEPSVKGLVRDVHVCDFASMYPSIIRSWNMSPETYAPDVVLEQGALPSYLLHAKRDAAPRVLPPGHCVAPNGAVFRTEPEGILPIAIGKILEMRKYWNKLKASFPPESPEWIDADRRATAYKIAANTFYGVQGCKFFRLYRYEVAEAVTQAGKWMIQEVIRAAEAAP